MLRLRFDLCKNICTIFPYKTTRSPSSIYIFDGIFKYGILILLFDMLSTKKN